MPADEIIKWYNPNRPDEPVRSVEELQRDIAEQIRNNLTVPSHMMESNERPSIADNAVIPDVIVTDLRPIIRIDPSLGKDVVIVSGEKDPVTGRPTLFVVKNVGEASEDFEPSCQNRLEDVE